LLPLLLLLCTGGDALPVLFVAGLAASRSAAVGTVFWCMQARKVEEYWNKQASKGQTK
jgi:hypothetical protein